MSYLELDDIIYNIQKFGGATTYWKELTSRLSEFVPGEIVRSTGHKFMRLYSPKSFARVYHSSHFRVAANPGVKNVTTVHDLIYEKGFGRGLSKFANLYERKKSVLRADAIICVSESTRRDLLEYYGDLIGAKPVHVIYHGCTSLPVRSLDQGSGLKCLKYLDLHLTAGQFFIFVGGRSGYKNFDLLLNAFAIGKFAENGFKLICTGAGFSDKERHQLDQLGLLKSVISIGFVDTILLGELYRVARALVYPSSYEGFGLPSLEAMAAGCPVICTRSSSLPEVVGSAGILVEPGSAEQLVDAMSSVLLDSARCHFIEAGIVQAKQFDWTKSARQHAKVYESLAEF